MRRLPASAPARTARDRRTVPRPPPPPPLDRSRHPRKCDRCSIDARREQQPAARRCCDIGSRPARTAPVPETSPTSAPMGAALRPALRHLADRISSADDAGATRLYRPMSRMIAGVLRRLFVQDDAAAAQQAAEGEGGSGTSTGTGRTSPEADALRSASVKLLEIVVVCFSTREQPGGGKGKMGDAKEVARRHNFQEVPELRLNVWKQFHCSGYLQIYNMLGGILY